ncbi:hypothetical protein GCM10028818_52930 [Spirosoma horti]
MRASSKSASSVAFTAVPGRDVARGILQRGHCHHRVVAGIAKDDPTPIDNRSVIVQLTMQNKIVRPLERLLLS